LREADIDDEEKLLEYYLKKREGKALEAEEIRDKQQKMIDLSEKIRKYDFNNIREEELDNIKSDMLKLNVSFRNKQTNIDSHLKFA
jgi:hypothetical protein